MTKLSDEQLIEYSREGLIPGPSEEEDDFIKRVDLCRQLNKKIGMPPGGDIVEPGLENSPQALEEAFPITKQLFGIEPAWIPLFYSNVNLAPWHGGCAWIFQTNEETPTAALLQLRKAFHNRKNYLGIYNRTELVAHELTHAGRMMFEEPKFEEILAYRTSPSAFRRWLGPILQSANETLIFILVVSFIFILDIFLLNSGHYELYHKLMWLKLIPCALIFYGFVRLFTKQRQFSTCLARLKDILNDDQRANAVIFRLTDDEIHLFAAMRPEEIQQYAQEQSSLRWRLLALYFFDKNA